MLLKSGERDARSGVTLVILPWFNIMRSVLNCPHAASKRDVNKTILMPGDLGGQHTMLKTEQCSWRHLLSSPDEHGVAFVQAHQNAHRP
ncbi:hypothetical protein AVEN_52064-1 [Araneus ventricosus]|uniref:Uncharacterized protein n=1 Tax=Araneus ventricosus TaxID=182803 RepID=A0A4Y2CHV0_ARAVE|nr:hypothetical protein AVEN_52064-1 [Araneus ventricosus]